MLHRLIPSTATPITRTAETQTPNTLITPLPSRRALAFPRKIVKNMRRIPILRLFGPHQRVLAPLNRPVPLLIHLLVHPLDIRPQTLNIGLLFLIPVHSLPLLFRLILFLRIPFQLLIQFIPGVLFLKVLGKLLAAAETETIAVAVACVHGWTVHLVAGENVVPDVFEDAAGELVVECGLEEPLSVVDEAFKRDLANTLS